jgi:hypothetical protein
MIYAVLALVFAIVNPKSQIVNDENACGIFANRHVFKRNPNQSGATYGN